ncbi:hypothetical protein NDU88_008951 [Pleurodeles waltl]|uniref:Uncharacterized protein n=1 Tax=Pleurodeles waltl TaxID=8319 RepID=A0AAV7RX75_PLEWA|nr:hypothetical protein NDU88_008951 [Pleurodeles waltl]
MVTGSRGADEGWRRSRTRLDTDLQLSLMRGGGLSARPRVQELQENFMPIKNLLREHHIQYSLVFPAKLRIQHDGKILFHDTPQAAMDWFERLSLSGSNRTQEWRETS